DESHVDMPGFPLFALFTLAMGMTSVIPDMDPTKPAQCDPAKLTRTLIDKKITFAAGSPAIWERVGKFCQQNKITLPHLQHVVMFGAPVKVEIHELWKDIIPHGTTHTPYGATECLPVSTFSGREVLSETAPMTRSGAGTCIGLPVEGNKVFIIKDADIPLGEIIELPPGERGEIVVLGPTVTPGYFENPKATELAKISTPLGLAHRMGDVGYKDISGRLWFCGRKSHVIKFEGASHYPIPIESLFNQHKAIKRSALIEDGHGPALAVEMNPGHQWSESIRLELIELGSKQAHTHIIKNFYPHPGFPVDVRHNIKIDRLALSRWAKEQRA
ncbi:MAG: AMP-binding protein, partial [Bacteriovoracaceae bacterium]|nr:AMP-binding protein [Bacteriovoracaceae bacterium]